MNPLYEKAKDVILIRRTSDNKEFEEYPLSIQPVSALVADPANDVQCVALCALTVGFAHSASFAETSSYSHTSSYALQALSSSWANSGSYVITSSYTFTASFALEASAALSAAYAVDAVSASHALYADYAGSAALLGRALNFHQSQSVGGGNPLAITHSVGTISQDGMYTLKFAGTVGFYSGSTPILSAYPSWSFKHTDRLGTYTLPQYQWYPDVVLGGNYSVGLSYCGEYNFQASAGTNVECYWFGLDPSSTPGSMSFYDTLTMAQVLSGSVNG